MTSQPPNLLQLAKQGDVQAISVLINRNLNSRGITATVVRKDSSLRVLLEAKEVPNQAALVNFIYSGIQKLNVVGISTLQILGKEIDDDLPVWSQTIKLREQLSLSPETQQQASSQRQTPVIQSPLQNRVIDRQEASGADAPIRCPICNSSQFTAGKKGFGLGKAAVGAVLLGPIGLAGGMLGSNRTMLSCMKCGHRWEPGKSSGTQKNKEIATNVPEQAQNSIYNFSAVSIDGDPIPFSVYKGKVLLIVNTASQCGFTPQYEGLQKLYDKYASKGLVILGFPCNQFGQQEPGTEEAIKAFCTDRYDINFPIFQKIDVNGNNAHPLYKYLAKEAPGMMGTEAIKWNFTKFLVDRKGKVVKRYSSATNPEDLEESIQVLLKK